MIKKHKFKTPHQSRFQRDGTGQETKETDQAREELKGLGDLPLVGGLFKGLEKFIDLVEEAEEAGGEIKKTGEIKGKEGVKGIYGFSIRTGTGERPKIQTFGNIRSTRIKEAKPKIKITEEREPIVDVFDEKDHILVVAELPGVSEESIKLELKGDILILQAGDEKRKYSKEILLSAKVDFEQRETNFKNGILEIKLKKI